MAMHGEFVADGAWVMYVVGLTGGIGSGKSTVAEHFVALGATLVDTDAIAHLLTAPGGAAMPALGKRFGAAVIRPDGALDRAAMRRLVLADPAAKKALEAILHPLIRAEADRSCAAALSPYVILAVPLLVESGGYRERCDRILVVDCPPGTQLARVMARGLGEAEARAFIAAQAGREQRLAVADDVIDNGGSRDDLPAKVAVLDRFYRAAALTKVKANC